MGLRLGDGRVFCNGIIIPRPTIKPFPAVCSVWCGISPPPPPSSVTSVDMCIKGYSDNSCGTVDGEVCGMVTPDECTLCVSV